MRKTEYVEALRAEVLSAIEAYGLTWREAEVVFGLPKSTLHDFCEGLVPSEKTLAKLMVCKALPEHAVAYADVLINWPDYIANGRRLPKIVTGDPEL